ncbi:MAG: isoprenylcysteine carboxylmethyltransferase family protein [Chloroflexota bacterium]
MTGRNQTGRGRALRKGIRQVVALLLANGCAFFISYGGVDWWQAWLLLAIWLIYYLMMLTYGRRHNPEVVQERAESFERDYQPWDRWIIPVYVVLSYSLYVVCGLDAGRFGWSDVPGWAMWLGLGLVVPVYLLPFWAVMSNPFASGTGRIQRERGHYAVSAGPYQYVRHPMYAAMIPFGFAFPLFLGSFWALIPGGLVVALFTLRTHLEDQFLLEKLEGYREYAEKVRWRLIPGVW